MWLTTVAGATAGDLSGTRVNQILDQIDWPATMRDIDAGLTTLQNDPGTLRTSLGAMQVAAQSEYGALYVDANGEFVFQDRAVTAGSIGGTVTTFNDNGTGSRTLAYGSFWDFIGGTAPTLTTTANAVDRIDYVVRTTGSIHAVFTANYS